MSKWKRRRRRQMIADLPADLVKRLILEGKQVMSLDEFVKKVKTHGV